MEKKVKLTKTEIEQLKIIQSTERGQHEVINMIVHQAAENANRQRILFEEIKRRLNITNVVIMNADSKTGEVKWDETTP